ncbi:MAG: galactokinase [Trueperella sp.]|nr:galactokinase [Trueperella sp.]
MSITTLQMSNLVPQVIAQFVDAYGYEPDGVWAAPGRVNLIGEHTDYNAGLCLPIALPHRTYVAYAAREDTQIRALSMQFPDAPWEGNIKQIAPGKVSGWVSYALGVAYPLGIEHGFDVVFASDVPEGAGLSSSAAVECAMALALCNTAEITMPQRRELALAAQRAENEVAGAATGGLDQMASLLTTDGHALWLDCADWSTQLIPFDLAAAGLQLLVIDTQAPHQLVDSEYAQRRELCERAAAELGLPNLRAAELADLARLDAEMQPYVRHVITEIDRVRQVADLLTAGEIRKIGPLFDASHNSLRDDYRVSSAELDLAVDTARAHGALGARMTGGGFGGSAIALVAASDSENIASAIANAFAAHGYNAPKFLPTWAAAGGGKVE